MCVYSIFSMLVPGLGFLLTALVLLIVGLLGCFFVNELCGEDECIERLRHSII